MKRYWIFLCVFVILGASAARAQESLAIRGATLLTVTHGVIENGTIVVEGGKITAVGPDARIPEGARVIDGRGKFVMPGMFDAGDYLGLIEIPAEQITDDTTEYNDPIHPELRVLDALNPQSEVIRVTRAEGITLALSTPAEGNLIAGQSAVIRLDGGTVDDMVVESPAALEINLGEPSKMLYGPKGKAPETRMGQMALLRQEFLKAQHYRQEHEAAAKHATEKPESKEAAKPAAPPATDLKMEVLLEALDGKLPVVIRADRLSDIEMALRLADEFHLRVILSEGTSAWRLAPLLAQKNIPVIVGPVLEAPESLEAADVRLDNAAKLVEAGVPIAFRTGTSGEARDLPFAVEYAIGYGLTPEAALAATTLNPARFFGLDSRYGSLDTGKQANLIVLDGMPFKVKTHVTAEIINGKVVDLSNHQTELFEFYKKKYGIH